MASQYVFQNSEVVGRAWDPELDFNINYPANAFPDYVSLGGRLDPSIESTRIRGGPNAVNQNRSMYIDNRVLAPYTNLYWDQLKRGDRWVDGNPPVLTDVPPGMMPGYSY
eukprot:jgi/Mesvir1/24137/Mv10854-RA.1